VKDIQQPVMRQGLLWIVEPPLSTGERMSENGHLPSLPRFAPMSGPKPVAAVQLWQLVDASDQ